MCIGTLESSGTKIMRGPIVRQLCERRKILKMSLMGGRVHTSTTSIFSSFLR